MHYCLFCSTAFKLLKQSHGKCHQKTASWWFRRYRSYQDCPKTKVTVVQMGLNYVWQHAIHKSQCGTHDRQHCFVGCTQQFQSAPARSFSQLAILSVLIIDINLKTDMLTTEPMLKEILCQSTISHTGSEWSKFLMGAGLQACDLLRGYRRE